jgi:NAD(P)-dependent dehydrogenase (short-subunit alcohol dehydrogenase family)
LAAPSLKGLPVAEPASACWTSTRKLPKRLRAKSCPVAATRKPIAATSPRATVSKAAFNEVFQEGRVHILVNNAGISHIGNLGGTPEDDFDRVFCFNVKGKSWICNSKIKLCW